MAIDHTIPMQVQGFDMLGMIENGSKLAQFYKQQKTEGELNRIYKESQGDLNKMLDLGRQSKVSQYVVPHIQGQISAQQQAQIEQQKTLADIDKTSSEAYKNNQQGTGYGVDTAQKKLGAIQGAIQQAALTGDKGVAMVALDGARRVGLMNDDDFQHQYKLLSSMSTEDVKTYAQSVAFANAKDPASLLFTSADNQLNNQTSAENNIRNNQTSENNNVRSTNASIYSTDVNAQTQANKLTLDQAKIQLEQKKGSIQQFGDNVYMVYPDGTAQPIEHAGSAISASKSGTNQKEEAMRLQRVDTVLPEIEKLIPHATSSYGGALLDQGARIFGKSTEGAQATAQLKALSGQLVALMPKMSGPQSDKDVAMYKEMAGNLADDTQPRETRMAALKTIKELNEKYKAQNQQGHGQSQQAQSSPNVFNYFQ